MVSQHTGWRPRWGSRKDRRAGTGAGYGPLVPVEFLTDEQAEAYGTFAEEPTRPELERFFFLDDVDRDLIARRRSTHHQLGFALQLGHLHGVRDDAPRPRRGRRDSTRRLRRPSVARPQPQVVTQRYTPRGGSCTRTGPSRWRRPPSVFSCASCAASAARPPRGGVRLEACDGSRRRGGMGDRAGHGVTGSGETVRPRLGER
nr:DUF4158 domain-containing protein [Streptomyces sp. LUP47B]